MSGIEIVANALSGTASRLGRDGLEALVVETLGDQLRRLQIVQPADVRTALERAFQSDAALVAVIGGDGTCRAAAEIAHEKGRPVVFLPGGTMNLLPKRIWGELDLKAALEALARGETMPIALDVAEVDGKLFLVAAMFGAAPALTRFRETLRRTRTLRDLGRLGADAMRGLRGLGRPTVRIVEPTGVGGLMPALLVTPGNATHALAGRNPDDPTPSLECVAATVNGWAGLAVATMRVLIGADWRNDKRLVSFNATRVSIGAPGRVMRATLDGEIVVVANPATLRFLPAGLATLGPRAAATAEPKIEAAV
ncbi:hypothetical protein sos41_39800 [Alphaproteobacteria bacterium SO-S41]|nr:hypothetical protein sos41_39800 [Alphaproteobacteria bacterium SO-S41]